MKIIWIDIHITITIHMKQNAQDEHFHAYSLIHLSENSYEHFYKHSYEHLYKMHMNVYMNIHMNILMNIFMNLYMKIKLII